MKKTVLEIVQDILNDMDADEVNSINDTTESIQVAQIVKTCYYEMLSNRNWPHMRKLIQLEASNDLDKPNYLQVPENLKEIELIRYQGQKIDDANIRYKDLKYKYPDEFLAITSNRNSSNSNVRQVADFGGSILFILNDVAPTYWTSFDDRYIVTDSYDAEQDDTLKRAKTQTLAYVYPDWDMEDDFVPDLPAEAFSGLIEEAKSTAFNSVKQLVNQKAEQKAARQSRWLSRKAWQAKGGVRYADYGRKSRK